MCCVPLGKLVLCAYWQTSFVCSAAPGEVVQCSVRATVENTRSRENCPLRRVPKMLSLLIKGSVRAHTAP